MTNIKHNISNNTIPGIDKVPFGNIDGNTIYRYTVTFGHALSSSFTNYGAIVQSLKYPDRDGKHIDLVLGHEHLQAYREDTRYTGAIVGRYANRIANGSYKWDGQTYQLSRNEGQHHLHGGFMGFNKVLWQIKLIERRDDEVVATMSYLSKDGEEGFPANVLFELKYIFRPHSFEIKCEAIADGDTPVNITHHHYFNLEGVSSESVGDHELQLNAAYYLPTDEFKIPLNGLASVQNTSFDLSSKQLLSSAIKQASGANTGLDLCYALKGGDPSARLYAPKSGIVMELCTNQKAIQLYTLPSSRHDGLFSAVCLEPQFFPNAPNSSLAEEAVLKKGEKYKFQALYSFSVKQ